jgi:hypothetical protein
LQEKNRMLATTAVDKTLLEELRVLKARRKPLFDWYEKNPNDTRLALEIKLIDDRVAECNRQIAGEKRS